MVFSERDLLDQYCDTDLGYWAPWHLPSEEVCGSRAHWEGSQLMVATRSHLKDIRKQT